MIRYCNPSAPGDQLALVDPMPSPDSSQLLDGRWAWQAYCREFGPHEFEPDQVNVIQFMHAPGRRATVLYEAQWPEDVYLPSEQFTLRMESDQPLRIYRFPDDPDLPGLSAAVFPEAAHDLIKAHVLSFTPRRTLVDVVRYRPGSHAVVRHLAGRAGFYARVVRPAAVLDILRARRIIAGSNFIVPRIAGHWPDGGVIWTPRIPGENLRLQIRAGKRPDPEVILRGLESLWATPPPSAQAAPFDLAWRYRDAKRVLDHASRDHDHLRRAFLDAVSVLDPFVEAWTPAAIAHNDFYDDQLLALPDGRMVLVDFEETGPGDPLLDVGNFLAHLSWASAHGNAGRSRARAEYRAAFRDAAIHRFHWDERDLNLREALCLLRLCTTPVRRPEPNGLQRLRDGLSLVSAALG